MSPMTTVPDLEAWVVGEIEQPCQHGIIPGLLNCGLPATWVVSLRKDCTCPGLTHGFLCNEHKLRLVDVPAGCTYCKQQVSWTFTERVRGTS